MTEIHCKSCPNETFHSIKELRKHQWAAHPEWYARLRKPKVKIAKQNSVRQYIGKAITNGNMTVDELLEEFKTQQKFLEDVIALIIEIRNRK